MKFDIQGLLESLWGYGRQFLVSLVCYQVRGLRDGPFARPEESE